MLVTARPDGPEEQREVRAAELVRLLTREFRIELGEADAEALGRVQSSGT